MTTIEKQKAFNRYMNRWLKSHSSQEEMIPERLFFSGWSAAMRHKPEKGKQMKCFRCGDGLTPLYCLNCAEDMKKGKQ